MGRSKSNSRSDESVKIPSDVRRRVVKACQRCSLKKCKCDGGSPCTRCKAHDAICAYGKHKKPDKIIYRKGYVQMLERQHVQLIAAVQELYRRVQTGQGWQGPRLEKVKYDRPLTHKILEELGVLQIDEWDEVNGSGAGWNTLEHQTPNDGFTYTSILNTPSTQTTFLPSTQEAFPNSTLIARRRMKSLGALTPGQTLSMPPLDTNFPSTATAGTFNAGVAYQLSLPFNVDNNINLGHTREIGVDMDCMVGITDLFDYSGGPGLLSVP